MVGHSFRSGCAVSSVLDLVGDKWSLLIIRDLLYYGKRTFKDFSQAGERISSARLSDRLSKLENLEVLTKSLHPTNKKVYVYTLTPKGLDFAPVLAEIISWAYKHLGSHISGASKSLAKQIKADRELTLSRFMKPYSN